MHIPNIRCLTGDISKPLSLVMAQQVAFLKQKLCWPKASVWGTTTLG